MLVRREEAYIAEATTPADMMMPIVDIIRLVSSRLVSSRLVSFHLKQSDRKT
jgi:hypothetical protein